MARWSCAAQAVSSMHAIVHIMHIVFNDAKNTKCLCGPGALGVAHQPHGPGCLLQNHEGQPSTTRQRPVRILPIISLQVLPVNFCEVQRLIATLRTFCTALPLHLTAGLYASFMTSYPVLNTALCIAARRMSCGGGSPILATCP